MIFHKTIPENHGLKFAFHPSYFAYFGLCCKIQCGKYASPKSIHDIIAEEGYSLVNFHFIRNPELVKPILGQYLHIYSIPFPDMLFVITFS